MLSIITRISIILIFVDWLLELREVLLSYLSRQTVFVPGRTASRVGSSNTPAFAEKFIHYTKILLCVLTI